MRQEDLRLLVVDDEPEICQLFRHALMKRGFQQVDMAGDGEEALEYCRLQPYHIIITDLKMPRRNGMSLLREVKQNWPETEVIVVTGYATIESAIEAMKIGSADFILKPVNFEHVFFTVQKSFERLASRKENASLRLQNRNLQELLLLKDKFLTITNHEMRTPITIMKGYLDILELSLEELDPETREVVDILKNTAEEMRETVDRMHVLTRLRKHNWYKSTDVVDVAMQINRICREMKQMFQARSLKLKLLLPEDPLLISGSEGALRLVIRELLHNALKFTPDGGLVTVEAVALAKRIVVSIRDTGVGIPNEKRDLIFTDFYEVQDSINHKTSRQGFLGGGMGLGLSLVKEVVESMKGKIEVESVVARGSVFNLSFPGTSQKPQDAGDKEVAAASSTDVPSHMDD